MTFQSFTPLAWQISEGLREGRIALRDPYTYCGFPLHANVQAQMFYPPAWPSFAAAALFPAICCELSGFFVSQVLHLGAICGAAWIPMAWRGAVELNGRPDARRTA